MTDTVLLSNRGAVPLGPFVTHRRGGGGGVVKGGGGELNAGGEGGGLVEHSKRVREESV